MNTMDIYDDKKSGLNYYARKYGRVSLIALIFLLSIFFSLGGGMNLNLESVSYGSSAKDKNVAIQGSKKVNPSTTSEYWTSSKFDF